MHKKPYVLRESAAANEATNELSYRIASWFRLVGADSVVRTCSTCSHMARVGPAVCELAQVTPPIDVIMSGCDKYEDERPLTRSQQRRKNEPEPEGFGDDDIPF